MGCFERNHRRMAGGTPMTQEGKNIKICETLGWKKVYQGPELDNRYIFEGLYKTIKDMPNHFTDLNAMHEAEASIPYDKLPEYVCRLAAITIASSATMCHIWEMSTRIAAIRASAAQRAEAFGLTLNLWKQEKLT